MGMKGIQMAKGMSAPEVMEVNAASQAKTKTPKVLDHIRITPAENGGASVEHHFTSYAHEPEMHVFGEKEAPKMMAHIRGALKIKGGEGADE